MRAYYLQRGKLKQETLKDFKRYKDFVVYEVWDVEELKRIFPKLELKDITIEDVLEENPVKLEEFEHTFLLVLYKPYILADDWDYEQVSIIAKDKMVIVFRGERSENLIKRIIKKFFSKKPLSKEFFIYVAIERFLAEYSSLVDFIEFRIRELEKQITDPETQIIEETYDIRDLILDIKQIIVGYRDVVFTLKS
ncbi:MAG: hypothetical protein GXN92_03195, partial [Candidatus Micrarchaeota archaeon]|nr:hypothetical protein [Candidatus Micrarchaeota archaeon]